MMLFLGMSKESPVKATIGKTAPEFTALTKHNGKIVVLEWYNDGCPFVRKHYDSQNMQKLQKKYTQKGVVWLKVISSAEGKQGYLKNQDEVKVKEREEGSYASEVFLDKNGEIGKLYGALTTPHMFIINADGNLVYNGAIDSISSYDISDIPKSKNYVAEALDDLLSGKNPKMAKTRPYGCSVKY